MNPIQRTVKQQIEYWAERQPTSQALVDVDSGAIYSYAELLSTIEDAGRTLSGAGIGTSDRVCTVFPNGIEAALAFFSVSSVAQCAPLNPMASPAELAKQISAIGPAMVIVDGRLAGQLELPDGLPAAMAKFESGSSHITFQPHEAQQGPAEGSPPGPDDIIAIVQTSGSTASPKLVPLKHHQMLTNASSFASALELSVDDRCLNIMQMHHVGGLQGTMLTTIWSGGTTICMPGFATDKIAGWLADLKPTWFEAVPTMLNALVNEGSGTPGKFAHHHLKMVRSSSAALSPALLEKVETLLGVPVIEAYGMSEAGLMAINPLTRSDRRPGSVGKIVNDSVTIVDSTGERLGTGEVGEIVARGPFVIDGYAEGGELSEESFADGAFRTGDLGSIDEDGYLTLVGRSKEMVNRGGENIGLREIDEAMELHPSVNLAAAFGVPHPSLGEEIYAAVVAREGSTVSVPELRSFLAERLAWSKVPKRIFFEESLPTNPTGKVLRRSLVAKYAPQTA